MFRTYFHYSSFSPNTYTGEERRKQAPGNPVASSRHQQDFQFGIAQSFDEFEALENDWKQLFEHSHDNDQPFQSFNWHWHWCRNYLCPDNQDKNLRIITLWENNKLVMLWPMQIKTFLGRKHLHFIGDPVSQHNDILLDRRADKIKLLHAGWRFIKDNLSIDLAVLRKVKSDAIIYPLIQDLRAHRTGVEQGLHIDFRNYKNQGEYKLRFKTKERKNRKRKLRRLQQLGEVRTEFFTEGPKASALARQAIQMKREWLQKRNLLSRAFKDRTIEQFFADVTASTEKNVNVVLSVLYVDDQEAAMTISFGAKNYRAMHISVIDLRFEKDSPGVTLLENTICHAMDQGDDILDFLAPADPYKKIWCDEISYLEDFAIATNLSGQLYMTIILKWIREGGKTLINNLPSHWRQKVNQMIAHYLWKVNK